MSLSKSIERATRHIVAKDYNNSKTEEEILNLSEKTLDAFNNSDYDFSTTSSLILTKNSKKRIIKYYDDIYSCENILCQCVKQIFDRTFKIKYPNRNKTCRKLFSYIGAMIQMSNFTIVRFDFKDFYNSVSTAYVFEKYIKERLSKRDELELVKNFCYSTNYAYAGLCTSNAISEIVASAFDEAIKNMFSGNGMLFYERYIDDCILLLNENINSSDINNMLNEVLNSVFFSNVECGHYKCKTKYNPNKFQYASKNSISATPVAIDFLGYEFLFKKENDQISVQYGITEEKRIKYKKRVKKFISLYQDPSSPDYNNLELLRHRIKAFASREVYISKHFKSDVWKVKGFISNYGELRYLLDTTLIDNNTELFLRNMIKDCFYETGLPLPYFLKTNGYDLYNSLKTNKTLLLVDTIGYDYKSLCSICEKIGISVIDSSGKKRKYRSLVRDYLIKLKVGY